MVKVPQILKIVMNSNVLGISFNSIIIETFMYALMIGYNIHRHNPFSLYGENVFLGSSNLFIIACFFRYSRDKKYAKYIRGTVLLFSVAAPLILQLVPDFVIENSLWLGILACRCVITQS